MKKREQVFTPHIISNGGVSYSLYKYACHCEVNASANTYPDSNINPNTDNVFEYSLNLENKHMATPIDRHKPSPYAIGLYFFLKRNFPTSRTGITFNDLNITTMGNMVYCKAVY